MVADMGTYDSVAKTSTSSAPTTSGTLGEQVLPKEGVQLRDVGGSRSADAKGGAPAALVAQMESAATFCATSASRVETMMASIAKGGDPVRVVSEIEDLVAAGKEKADALTADRQNKIVDPVAAKAALRLTELGLKFSVAVYAAEPTLREKLHHPDLLKLMDHWGLDRQALRSAGDILRGKFQ